MSYKSELEDHYKRVRMRLMTGVKPAAAPLLLAAPGARVGGVAGSTGVVSPKAIRRAEKDFIAIKRRRETCDISTRIVDDVSKYPRLPPLRDPAADLGNISVWRRLVAAVAREHEVTPEQILGKGRSHHIVDARMECMYRMRVELLMSPPNIGDKLGRDHSTVLHGVRKVRTRLLDEMREKEHAGDPALMTLRPETGGRLPELVVA